ncbi:MAG: spore germination protein [Acutalibacteraceae bacterium]
MNISSNIDENIRLIKEILPVKKSFDVIIREILVDNHKAFLLFIDGFVKDTIMVHVMKELQKVKDEKKDTARKILLENIPYIEASVQNDLDQVITEVLSGQVALFVDGNTTAVMIDTREYPAREPSESHIEKTTRGARDDLVETIIFNTALIRRRIRDPKLVFEAIKVGNVSKTDVAVGYIEDKVDKKLLNKVITRLKSIDVHALTMGETSLEEVLLKKKWYNPMPLFRVSERPETIAAHVMEGHIVLLVDNSPTALILPTTLLYFTQYVEDYYQTPITGTFTRLIRMLAIPVALYLVPLFLLITQYPTVNHFFSFLVPTETAEISIFAQILFIEFWLEVLRLSALHTPSNVESAFSIIGGLILGDFAISMQLLIADTMLFAVASAICNHCIPNPELGNAVKVFRWFLIVMTGFFKLWGFIAGFIIETLIVVTTKTFDEQHGYLWPIIPFNFKALKHILIRYPLAKFENNKK